MVFKLLWLESIIKRIFNFEVNLNLGKLMRLNSSIILKIGN